MAILTVYTKLLDQTLSGPRLIDLGSTKTCQCLVLPLDSINKIDKQYIEKKYAFYILLGNSKIGRPKAYIGQTNDFLTRVENHKSKKLWWEIALVFTSKAQEIFSSEVQYLEYLGWKTATKGDYDLDNSKPINEPGLSEDKKNDMELFFDEIKFLTEFYGCSIFKERKNALEDKAFTRFFLNVPSREIKAEVRYFHMQKHYILTAGSTISAIERSCSKGAKELRAKIINNTEHSKLSGNIYKILEDLILTSPTGKPSLIAQVITGTSMQGTTAFIDKDGKTFAERYPNL